MLKAVFIRHGKTQGNLENKYIGTTDQPLCEQGIQEIKSKNFPPADIVYTSKLERTIATAKLIYPSKEIIEIEGFNECNFGDFENKNYQELFEQDDYQNWLKSNGEMPFPNGEEHFEFKKRCINSYIHAINCHKNQNITIAIVVHGGTIMAIFEKFANPQKKFYDWQVKNAQGYTAVVTDNYRLTDVQQI